MCSLCFFLIFFSSSDLLSQQLGTDIRTTDRYTEYEPTFARFWKMSSLLQLRLLYLGQQADEADSPSVRRRQRSAAEDAFLMPDFLFRKSYRLPKQSVRELVEKLRPHLRQSTRRIKLDATTKVLIALGFYATGSYQTLVGQSSTHAVSQPTVSRTIHEVTEALNVIFSEYVRFPLTQADRDRIRARFYSKYSIPGVVGCIDGTHVSIVKPVEHEELYYCRKGYHSLNVMIICDADMNILSVDPSFPGRTHDATVWRDHPLNSHLLELADTAETNFLLGDSGYPLRTTLLTPILNTQNGSPEQHYYNMHVTARNAVERTIGLLKGRFRCLLAARKLHYEPAFAGKIVNACCVLHNILNATRTPVPTDGEIDEERRMQDMLSAVDEESPVDHRNIPLQQGRILRTKLVHQLWHNRNN